MKKITLYLMFMLPIVLLAQGGSNPRHQKIQAAKIGLITEKLNLTPEQAPQFWAIYNEFARKRLENRRSIKKYLDEANSLSSTDDKIILAHKQIVALRRKELELEEDYGAKLMKVITPRQYGELKRTEANFNKILREKLKERIEVDN